MGKKVEVLEYQLIEIKTLFNNGDGSRLIAKKLNLSRSVIKRVFKDLNLDGSLRGTPKRPFIGLEKTCSYCKITKSINSFNLMNAGNGRKIYRYCAPCEKEFININNARYKANKIKNDPAWVLNKNTADIINLSIKYINSYQVKIEDILPYTMKELKIHLESQFESWMSWNNYGSYNKQLWNDNDKTTWKWNIDHIKPKSDFKYSSIDDIYFIECWSLDNLRPYSAKQNLLDGVNRIRHKVVSNKIT